MIVSVPETLEGFSCCSSSILKCALATLCAVRCGGGSGASLMPARGDLSPMVEELAFRGREGDFRGEDPPPELCSELVDDLRRSAGEGGCEVDCEVGWPESGFSRPGLWEVEPVVWTYVEDGSNTSAYGEGGREVAEAAAIVRFSSESESAFSSLFIWGGSGASEGDDSLDSL